MTRGLMVHTTNACVPTPGRAESDADPVVETDAVEVVTGWTPKAASLFGWEAEEVGGRDLCESLVAPAERLRFHKWRDQLRSRHPCLMEEFGVTTRDGLHFRALFKLLPPFGMGTHQRISIRALTERAPRTNEEPFWAEELLKAQDELRHHQFLLQYIINFVPHSIFWKDRQDRFLGGNEEFLTKSLRVSSPEEVIGKSDFDFHTREEAEHYRRCDRIVMESGQPMLDMEEPQTDRQGNVRTLLVSKVPLRNEDAEIIGVLGVFADITERKKTMRELEMALENLRKAQADLVQSEKMAAVGTLIAGLSHELNNPLAAISVYTDLLLANPGSEAIAAKALPVIRAQAERCGNLVRALLEFSRRKPPTREPVPLRRLLEQIQELAAPMARQRSVRMELEEPACGNSASTLSASRQDLETAVLNLVTNALAATPPGGAVRIRAEPADEGDNHGVAIFVIDTGQGIADEVMSKIFDPFFTTKPPGEGTGIGLPLARRIVESHGGTLRLTSKIGCGTVARVWLPMSPSEEQC
ncbi:MAG TPA: ATP-binding protein [Labilithrix sp.]|nr:ATP-binding protein [Labilithrix sp.]